MVGTCRLQISCNVQLVSLFYLELLLFLHYNKGQPGARALKPGFHYPSWRSQLTAGVDGRPVSITRQHWPSTQLVETGLKYSPVASWRTPNVTWKCADTILRRSLFYECQYINLFLQFDHQLDTRASRLEYVMCVVFRLLTILMLLSPLERMCCNADCLTAAGRWEMDRNPLWTTMILLLL